MLRGRTYAALSLVLATVLWGCPPTPKPGPPPAKGTLTFEDDGVSWVTTNNYFAQQRRPSVPRWYGILFQFGPFTNNVFEGEVEFLSPTGSALTTAPLTSEGKLAESQITWINIVSSRSGAETPVLPEEALVLFPNTVQTHPCDASASGNPCLRDRRIHIDQPQLSFIVTYWQGDSGYEMSSAIDSEHPDRNKLEFKLKDDFTVEVYHLSSTGPMEQVVSFDAGVVGTIKIHNEQSGGPHGGKHDPIWGL